MSPALRFSIVFGALLAGLGVFVPFWPLWLQSRGCEPHEIALLAAAPIWARGLLTPFLAREVDRSGRQKGAINLLAWCAVVSFASFHFAHSFLPLLAISFLFGVTYSSVTPLLDNLAMLESRRNGLHYGRARLWGSIGFLSLSAAAGALIEGRSAEIVYGLTLGCVLVCALSSHFLPNVDRVAARTGPRASLRSLLRRRDLLGVLIACGLVQGSHAAYYTFSTLKWKSAGHSADLIGALWAEGVICEVVLFAVAASVVRRLGARRLLLTGAIAATLRWIGTATTDALPALLVLQCGHALSFGATHLAGVELISRRVDTSASATAQSLLAAATGISLALSTALAGPLFDASPNGAFLAMAGLSVLGGVVTVALPPREAVADGISGGNESRGG